MYDLHAVLSHRDENSRSIILIDRIGSVEICSAVSKDADLLCGCGVLHGSEKAARRDGSNPLELAGLLGARRHVRIDRSTSLLLLLLLLIVSFMNLEAVLLALGSLLFRRTDPYDVIQTYLSIELSSLLISIERQGLGMMI